MESAPFLMEWNATLHFSWPLGTEIFLSDAPVKIYAQITRKLGRTLSEGRAEYVNLRRKKKNRSPSPESRPNVF